MNVKAIVRLVIDDSGQDLVEYAVVSAAVTFGSLVFVALVASTLGNAYASWQTAAQAAWEPCPPGGCS